MFIIGFSVKVNQKYLLLKTKTTLITFVKNETKNKSISKSLSFNYTSFIVLKRNQRETYSKS